MRIPPEYEATLLTIVELRIVATLFRIAMPPPPKKLEVRPAELPDTARRWVMRVPPDRHLRIDTNDYSLDPALVGRRVEVRADQRQVRAVVLDTGEVACAHARVFARHRTITALEHARALRDGRAPAQTPVEVRPLARYDALIA